MTKKEWWDKYTIFELCKDHSDFFDEWWDPNKFSWDGLFGRSSSNFMLKNVDWSISVDSLLRHCLNKFSDLQIKQLLLHPHNEARKFAKEAYRRKVNDKERVVE